MCANVDECVNLNPSPKNEAPMQLNYKHDNVFLEHID